MASRRKSAKPTNKLRHVHMEDEDDDEEGDEEIVSLSSVPLKIPYCNEPQPQLNQPGKMGECGVAPSFLGMHVNLTKTKTARPGCQPLVINGSLSTHDRADSSNDTMEPILALPSDVYKDFEALRSSTKLDSPGLMRRLLKYYNKLSLTNSTASRERTLDDVIESIRGRSSNTSDNNGAPNTNTAVLDLSVNKNNTKPAVPPETLTPTDIHPDDSSLTDNPDSPGYPLDLTLQKQTTTDCGMSADTEPEVYSRIKRDSASSLFSTCIQTPSASSCFYTSTELKQAAPYVINLESPTTTVEMSSSIRQLSKTEQRNNKRPSIYDVTSFTARPNRLINVESFPQDLHTHISIAPTVISGAQSILSVPAVTQPRPIHSSPPSYPPSALFPMTKAPLPSYSEAVNSTLNVNRGVITNTTNSPRTNKTNDNYSNKEWSTKPTTLDSTNPLVNSDGRHISVLQIRPVKSFEHPTTTLENFLFEASDQKESRPQCIYSTPTNFLLSEAAPALSLKTTPFASSQMPSMFLENSKLQTKPDSLPIIGNEHNLNQISRSDETHSNSETPSPSSSTTLPGHVLLPPFTSSTVSMSQMYPHATMSVPAVFMSQTSDGALSNVVAIPVLQGLPEGFTSLQHFTFEPSTSLPIKSEIPSLQMTSSLHHPQPVTIPLAATSIDNSFLHQVSTMSKPTTSLTMTAGVKTSQVYVSSITSEPKKEWVKTRPGRPKGRTGKVSSSKKNQSKDMKLLTENSLFPGVYTSILKLPWSKRTRNKSKGKTDTGGKGRRNEVVGESVEDRRVVVENEERDLTLIPSYPQSEMLQVADPMRESLMETSSDSKGDNKVFIHSQHVEVQKQELEQQRRLHYQYQARLREEQQIMQKEFEDTMTIQPIPCSSPASGVSPPPDCSFSTMNIKNELCDNNDIQSEIRHNVMLSSASIAASQEQHIPNSQDPIMLIYPNIGPNGSKSRKRRGRPPKKPIVESKGHPDSFLFPVDSIFYPSDPMPDTSFIHGNNQNLTFIPTVPSSINQDLSLMSPTSLTSSFNSPEKTTSDTLKMSSNPPSDLPSFQENDETTLENKIIFLTNQIEMEMVRGTRQQAKEINTSDGLGMKDERNQNTTSGQDYEFMSPNISKPTEKPPPGTRRKKTSRMLKSNENFIYATFRFKPRGGGSGGKKIKKKRRNNITSLAANAETIANLRNKKLRCSESVTKRDKDSTKPDSCVQSWKFHEQYPCTSNNSKGNNPFPVLSIVSCSSCGKLCRKQEDNSSGEHFCSTCSSQQQNKSIQHQEDENGNSMIYNEQFKTDHYETSDNAFIDDKGEETITTSCISCGKKFEKVFPDSSSQCDTCMRNIQSLISSSKLFSIQNTSDSPFISQTVSTASVPEVNQHSDSKTNVTLAAPNSNMATSGILFCSLCRMQFTKISDYLLHIKETHETTNAEPVASLQITSMTDSLKSSLDSSQRRVRATLKTKKSLAHKTITCPVEDCPLFFRHKRDMDHHLRKAHQSNTTESSNSSQQGSNSKQTKIGSNLSMEDTPPSSFSPLSNSPLTIAVEENESPKTPTHKNEKPLQCSFCDFRCRQKNAMTWHMRKHPEAASQHRRYSNVSSD